MESGSFCKSTKATLCEEFSRSSKRSARRYAAVLDLFGMAGFIVADDYCVLVFGVDG
jgi:hypothetical protein